MLPKVEVNESKKRRSYNFLDYF